ncbi:MAG TPA: NAD-binding protein [Stellaceae bacterium]|nr:NAD-binding protein [Stellaceae bacterium]
MRETAGDDPTMIVVGDDALALNVAAEILALQGHRVCVLWYENAEFAHAVERIGAQFVAGSPDSAEGLDRAGVREAVTILALSRDDRLNLHAALRARDANPQIRIVLRQLNRTLARKVEQNLTNSSVLSPTVHSAATYAAAAVDPACFRGVQFPEPEGPLAGFVRRKAGDCRVAGLSVAAAERELAMRILAVDDDIGAAREAVLAAQSELVMFGEIARLQGATPRRLPRPRRPPLRRRLRTRLRRLRQRSRRIDPILVRLALAALAVFAAATVYFYVVFGKGWLTAAYFVITTMTTTGYGDVTPNRADPSEVIAAMLLMLSGIGFIGIFIALAAAALTRIQWVAMQGLRRVRRHGHIVVCGAGSIGSGVIDLLLALDRPLVVVEVAPDTGIVEQARERRFDLLTGDASRDRTLDLCNLAGAHSLLALTNVDTLNLEIALGARARNPHLPIVLRIAGADFAASIARHFEFETTFSAAALAAPAFAGLSRIAGARGRVAFAGQEFAIGEFTIGDPVRREEVAAGIALALARGDDFALAGDFAKAALGDRALALFPLAPFKEGRDTLDAAAERFYGTESPP